MKKPSKRSNRKANAHQFIEDDAPVVTFYTPKHAKPAKRPLEPRNEIQARYMQTIIGHDVTFGIGAAGTGKTYIPCGLAAQELDARRIDKIILSRPAVDAGEDMGFLPGDLTEKYEPYLAPVREALIERLGKGAYEAFLKEGKILPVPIGKMRGRTFNDAWVIIDEAQNVTAEQMKMILTRIGENCKMIICGDDDQVDIRDMSGLVDAQRRTAWSPSFATIKFEVEDCVRSGVALDVLKSYRR